MATDKYDSLSDIWKLKKRGKRDSDRQKELIERAIRKNGKDIIAEQDIIMSDGNKKIKIPIRFLERYRTKYGKIHNQEDVGQGMNGKKGDRYKIKNGKSNQPGMPGNEEGEKVFDAEITVDELVNIMIDELELPWLEPTNTTTIEKENEELSSIEKIGIMPNLNLKKSLLENLKRNAAQGKNELGGFTKEDLRYYSWETEKEYHSNAVIFLMMDRSGSMDKSKTQIAKSFYFWVVQFLKRRYKHVEIVFIAHDMVAFTVDEKQFFSISASGGTECSSAFQLAQELIQEKYSSGNFNIFVLESSDGDNSMSDNHKCSDLVRQLLPVCKAIGYFEIMLGEKNPWSSSGDNLLSAHFNKEIKRTRFVSTQITSRDDIYRALKLFFNVENSAVKVDKK